MKTYCYEYPRPAVAVDLVLFGIIDQKLVVLRAVGLPPHSRGVRLSWNLCPRR